MLLLVVIAFLHLPTATVSLRTHLFSTLKVKCDSLLYRSAYVNDQCYFALFQSIKESKASAKCSNVINGAKAVWKVPASGFEGIMVDKSKFRLEEDSEANYTICAYESGYKCDSSEIMMNSGNCLIRAPKKMNFADANTYCHARGMELPALGRRVTTLGINRFPESTIPRTTDSWNRLIPNDGNRLILGIVEESKRQPYPAPANDLDNRNVRDILVKDPVWVQKSFLQENKFKWSQARDYSRWTTCDRTENDCSKKNSAAVVNQIGYWNNTGVQSLMDVICVKPAVNEFTPEAKISCNYHEDASVSAEKLAQLPLVSSGHVPSKTCYRASRPTTRYDIMGKAAVETQRGCEALCDSKKTCAGLSFKEAGISSECILLATSALNQICPAPINIFLKQTDGCTVRTNLAAEFGVDPCVDEIIPIQQQLGAMQICPRDKRILVIRAIDANGRRITLDNSLDNWLEKSGDMWAYRFREIRIPIVAATCAVTGGAKCPCKPIRKLTDEGQVFLYPPATSGGWTLPVGPHLKRPTNYEAKPDQWNACGVNTYLFWNLAKNETLYWYFPPETQNPGTYVSCKAGMWMMWHWTNYNAVGITALACYK